MKVLANDGISKTGELALTEAGFEVLPNRVAQDHVINFINENKFVKSYNHSLISNSLDSPENSLIFFIASC